MSFLNTPEHSDAYQADLDTNGYVANYTKLFALRPNVLAAWQGLNVSVKHGMDLRRYELATLAAARALRSSYCALAHGKVLRDKFYDAETVEALARKDHDSAGLDDADVAVMEFAAKVALNAPSITAEDVDALRAHGLSDVDVFQVILAAAARCFFSTVLDAAGAQPDSAYRAIMEPGLQEALTFGRPIATES
jgi:uncharacterized peroxidase-related enzyme